MKGLLLKDWFVIWKQGKLMIILALFYGVMAATDNSYFFAGFSVVFLSMLPITIMGLDERSKWDNYAVTMPYSRKEMVLSKYILSVIGATAATLIYIIANAIRWVVVKETPDFKNLLNQVIPMISLGFIFSTFNLPVMFKLGVDKGRMWLILITVIFVGGVGAIISIVDAETEQLANFILSLPVYLIPLISIAMLVLSALIAIRIYEKREL